MADHEVYSKGHEGDDERSMTTSQDSKSALPDAHSQPSEYSTQDFDEHRKNSEAINSRENRPSKGGKALAALRNTRHDQLINEYKKYFPMPESADDEISIRSLQQENDSSSSQQIAPLRSPEHDMVIGEFKKHFVSDAHHSEKTISESSRSDEEDEERGAIRVIDKSKDHVQESGNESSSEKSDISSDRNINAAKKVVKDEKLPKSEKIFLLELEPEINQIDVGKKIEPLMKPVPFVPPPTISDGRHLKDAYEANINDRNSGHPPQIHVDFSERRPTDDDEKSERYSMKEEEQKSEPEKVLKPLKEEKREGKVAGVEFEKQKPIQTIVEMFGGSVTHDRIDATGDEEDGDDLKGGQSSKGKRGIPAIAVKYVEAVNATPIIKNRTSAYDELNIYNESIVYRSFFLGDTSEKKEEEVESEKEDQLRPQIKYEENRILTEDERYMSVRVVRNVREYVEKHDRDSGLMIKMLDEKRKAKLRNDKKTNQHEPIKKETGVQVHIEEDSKGADSTMQHGVKNTKKQSSLPLVERKKVFESDKKGRIVEEINSKVIQEKNERKSSEETHQQSTTQTSNGQNGDIIEKKSEETQVENKKLVDNEAKYHIKIKPVAQRRQLFEAAAAANASTQ